MNKCIIIIFTIFFSGNSLFAKNIKGIIISQKNDTMQVVFDIPVNLFTQQPNIEKLQWKVNYIDSNNKKQIVKPFQAKEISFNYKGENIRMISTRNNLGLKAPFFGDNSFIFLRLIIDGKMKLYNYYYTDYYYSPGVHNSTTGTTTEAIPYTAKNFILQKDTAELFQAGWLLFKKDMIDYLSDCPELAKKMKDKIYLKKDVALIVNEYNKEWVNH